MVEDNQVFHKTEKGQREISSPGGALSPKQRRCLILVDGNKDAGALSAMFRPGEVGTLLGELQAGGYIAGEGGAAAAPAAGAAAAAPGAGGVIDAASFESIRHRAAQEISHRLGPNGDPLSEKIERCTNPQDLRLALRDAERTLEMFLGPAAGKNFMTKLGL